MARRSAPGLILPSGLLAIVRVVGACLVYFGVLSAAQLVAIGLSLTIVPDPARGTFGLLGLGIAEGAALLTVLLVWRLVDRRPVGGMGLYADRPVHRWFKGAAIAGLMMGFIVLVGFTLIDGAGWDVNGDAVRATLALLAGLVGFLIQGPSEEILFRGYMLENLRDQWGLRAAVVVTSLAFGLAHAPNPAFGLLPFINLVLFGVAAALYKVYLDSNLLWGIFAIHTVWNWLQQVVFGLPNSGIAAAPEYSLFIVSPNPALPGPFWGGGFGPEGTLAATLVLLAFIGVCLRRAQRAQASKAEKPKRRVSMARTD